MNPYDPHNYDDFYADNYGGWGNASGNTGRRNGPEGGPRNGVRDGPPSMSGPGRFNNRGNAPPPRSLTGGGWVKVFAVSRGRLIIVGFSVSTTDKEAYSAAAEEGTTILEEEVVTGWTATVHTTATFGAIPRPTGVSISLRLAWWTRDHHHLLSTNRDQVAKTPHKWQYLKT